MKRYIEFIGEAKKYLTLEEQWFNAISNYNITQVKNLIDLGIDVNIKNRFDNVGVLLAAASEKSIDILKLLLQQPDIDITIENKVHCFMDYIRDKSKIKKELINYSLQKKILANGREDILLLFDKYNLVHPDIKKEYASLFQAEKWGLI